MPQVRMPTGELVEMPDNPTPEQLADLAAISAPPPTAQAAPPQEQMPAEPPPTQHAPWGAPGSITNKIQDFLSDKQFANPAVAGLARGTGLAARALAQGVTGTATTLADPMTALANRALGTRGQLPSQLLNSAFPTPHTTAEKIANVAGSIATGTKDPLMGALTSRFLPPVAAPRPLDPRQSAIAQGQGAGYVAPPSAVEGSGTMSAIAERLSGKEALAQSMALKNQSVTDKLARKVTGLADNSPITDDAINGAMQSTYQKGYQPVEQLGRITTGGVYRRSLDKVLTDFHGQSRSFPDASDAGVRDLVSSYQVRQFDSKDALSAIQNLRGQADQAFQAGNTNLAQAAKGISRALEDNIELNLVNRGVDGKAILNNFKDARKTLAQQDVVRKALERATGNVSATKIGERVQRAGENYLTGDLAKIGNFARNAPTVSKVPQVQSVPIYGTGVRGGLYTTVGALTGGAPGAAVGAALPLGQAGLRRWLMSQHVQKGLGPSMTPSMLQQLQADPNFVNTLPGAMQNGLFGQ